MSKVLITGSVLFLPLLVFAQGQPRNLTDLIGRLVEILNALIPLLFGIALIGFLWGVAQFILQADNEEKRKQGKQIMIWGIIGLFVMTAVWGIVLIIGGSFGIRFLERPQTPQLPVGSSRTTNIPSRTPGFDANNPIRDFEGIFGSSDANNPIRDFEGLPDSQSPEYLQQGFDPQGL